MESSDRAKQTEARAGVTVTAMTKWILNSSRLLSEDNNNRNMCVCLYLTWLNHSVVLNECMSSAMCDWYQPLLKVHFSVRVRCLEPDESKLFTLYGLLKVLLYSGSLLQRWMVLPHYALVEPELEKRCGCTRAVTYKRAITWKLRSAVIS